MDIQMRIYITIRIIWEGHPTTIAVCPWMGYLTEMVISLRLLVTSNEIFRKFMEQLG